MRGIANPCCSFFEGKDSMSMAVPNADDSASRPLLPGRIGGLYGPRSTVGPVG